jgi:predicted O-methyltransferase YrrM
MRLIGYLSEMAAAPLKRRNLRQFRGKTGKTNGSVPFGIYRILPARLKEWVKYRVIDATESEIRDSLKNGHPISDIVQECLNPWSITPATIWTIWNHILDKSPQRIIELGSGLSTLLFARYAAMRKESNLAAPLIVSLEHDREWLDHSRSLLKKFKLGDNVKLFYAPIVEQELLGGKHSSYQFPDKEIQELLSGCHFDFALIDGPPAHLYGRFASLPLLAPWMQNKATILLDDAFRSGEQAALAEWQRRFNGNPADSKLFFTGHGLHIGVWKTHKF